MRGRTVRPVQVPAPGAGAGSLGVEGGETVTGGEGLLSADHPLAVALAAAGFHATPRGLRIRA